MVRKACALFALLGFSTLAVTAAGCQPPSETTREKGTLDASGYALVRADASSDNHHWSVDLSVRAAPSGTYALIFSATEPLRQTIPANDPALQCAAARSKGCTSAAFTGEVVALTRIGPGGAGVLRAAFDVGLGGWFTVVRIEGGVTHAEANASFDVQILSEALSKEEEPHRFAIKQVR